MIEWISIEKQLPEYEGYYWVQTVDRSSPFVAYWTEDRFYEFKLWYLDGTISKVEHEVVPLVFKWAHFRKPGGEGQNEQT